MENTLCSLKTIQDIRARHGFAFTKSLGQNFLVNPDIPRQIAEGAGIDADTGVIEVGPGIGCLTFELAQRAKKVVAVELDRSLLPVLGETLAAFDNVSVVSADVLKLDLGELIEREFAGMRVVVCANLPYYITTPVIMKFLEAGLSVDSLTVMVQREVAERFLAPAGQKEYGAISVAVQYYSAPRLLLRVGRGNFHPAPKVDSAVIRMDILQDRGAKVANEAFFLSVVRAAFGQRRKTLQNALANGLAQIGKQDVVKALTEMGVDADIRGERLSLSEFAALSDLLIQYLHNCEKFHK